MMGEDRSDPRPMLAIFALLVTAAIWRAVSSIRLDQLLASAASLAPFALGALAIASALATQRFLATRRTLAPRRRSRGRPGRRVRREARGGPARSPPSWRAADRSVRGWFDRRACALRVRLTNDREGRLVYLLEVPPARASCCATPCAATRESSCAMPPRWRLSARTARAERRRCAPSWSSPAPASSRWPGSTSTPTRCSPSPRRWPRFGPSAASG